MDITHGGINPFQIILLLLSLLFLENLIKLEILFTNIFLCCPQIKILSQFSPVAALGSILLPSLFQSSFHQNSWIKTNGFFLMHAIIVINTARAIKLLFLRPMVENSQYKITLTSAPKM